MGSGLKVYVGLWVWGMTCKAQALELLMYRVQGLEWPQNGYCSKQGSSWFQGSKRSSHNFEKPASMILRRHSEIYELQGLQLQVFPEGFSLLYTRNLKRSSS